MSLPFSVRAGALAGLGVALLLPGVATADSDWIPAAGDLGLSSTRYAIHVGGSWGPVSGTEVENTEPASGVEIGVSVRVLWSVSAYGSFAWSRSTVKGQIVQLLDQEVRADGRSGNVDGELTSRRLRYGVRVDGLRQEGWPFQIYFVGAAVQSVNEVTINSLDHVSPPPPIPLSGGRTLDIGKFDDGGQWGFLGRVGVEYLVTKQAWVYGNFTYEVVEPPPGTYATASINAGLTYRI